MPGNIYFRPKHNKMADKLSTTQSSSGLDLKFDIFETHFKKYKKQNRSHKSRTASVMPKTEYVLKATDHLSSYKKAEPLL